MGGRIASYDILRGIGIILMLYAHTYFTKSSLWPYIMSFHMPLFFIVSGLFFKRSHYIAHFFQPFAPFVVINLIEEFAKPVTLAFRLLQPYLFICVAQVLLTTAHHFYAFHQAAIQWQFLYDCSSPAWFLLALLIGRILFSVIINMCPKWHLAVSLAISTFSLILTDRLEIPPVFSLTSGTGSLIFLSIGYFVKEHDLLSKMSAHKYYYAIVALLLWLCSSIWGQTDVHLNIYKLWIIDYLGACGGTYLFFVISQSIEENTHFCKLFLERFGYYSLVILSFHAIEFALPQWFQIVFFLKDPYTLIAIFACRLLIAELSIRLTLRNLLLKKLFHIDR